MNNLFPYKWYLKDGYPAKGIKPNNLNIFGTFICGGGSTMGYKLAGYNHLGGVEIDSKVAEVYRLNHKPKYLYVEDIRYFVKRNDLPDELYNLDLLDGSPPCSSFSMAGNREKDWGKEKVFREGQAKQTLDDLFFDYIALAKKLQPKIVLAENVKGLIQGNAKSYVKKIKAGFENAGYKVQLFLLNAASMGVPQKRERVFFICQRKDLGLPELKLRFNEKPVLFINIYDKTETKKDLTQVQYNLWEKQKPSDKTLADIRGTANGFTDNLVSINDICPTITGGGKFLCKNSPRWFNNLEYCQCGTYPVDYNFYGIDSQFIIGMSVPPVMTAQIANQLYLQWFSKLNLSVEKQLKHG